MKEMSCHLKLSRAGRRSLRSGDVTACSFLDPYCTVGRTCCMQLQTTGWGPVEGGRTFLPNAKCLYRKLHTVTYRREQYSKQMLIIMPADDRWDLTLTLLTWRIW